MIPITLTNTATGETLRFPEDEVKNFSVAHNEVSLSLDTGSKEKHRPLWSWFANREKITLDMLRDPLIGYIVDYSGDIREPYTIGGPFRYYIDIKLKCCPDRR